MDINDKYGITWEWQRVKVPCETCKGTGKYYWESWYGGELLNCGDKCRNCFEGKQEISKRVFFKE